MSAPTPIYRVLPGLSTPLRSGADPDPDRARPDSYRRGCAGHAAAYPRIGHIAISSGTLFEGYVGGGDKRRWRGFPNTDDLGHVDPAGHVFVDGREDDRIVSGGENVFPQEVADTLLGHRDVADAAVFGVADEEFGQRLKAFVVPRADISEAYLKTRIARYKVPHLIFFLDNLPRNPGGKVLKQALAMG